MSEFQVTGEMIHYVMIHCVCVCVCACRSKLGSIVGCSRAKFYENHNKHSGITERNFHRRGAIS